MLRTRSDPDLLCRIRIRPTWMIKNAEQFSYNKTVKLSFSNKLYFSFSRRKIIFWKLQNIVIWYNRIIANNFHKRRCYLLSCINAKTVRRRRCYLLSFINAKTFRRRRCYLLSFINAKTFRRRRCHHQSPDEPEQDGGRHGQLSLSGRGNSG